MATTYGLSALVFGTPSITGYVVQTHSVSSKSALVAEVMNEQGQRVHARYDDITNELSFDALFQGATLPTAGGTFTVDGVEYEVLSIDLKRDNKGFKQVTIKGKNSANITLS